MIITIIIFLLILGLLVFVHELGHFLVARRFGVKAEEFGFGFPPRAAGIYRDEAGKWQKTRGSQPISAPGTIYSLNWLPLGGFVRIKGENGDSADQDSFMSKAAWKRALILVAGVTMNFILAAFLLAGGFLFGLPQSLDTVDPRAMVRDRRIQVVEVIADSPAATAGLLSGDIIRSIDGQSFNTYQELQDYVGEKAGQALRYDILRETDALTLTVTPDIRPETGRGGAGVAVWEVGLVRYPVHLAVIKGFESAVELTSAILSAFGSLIADLVRGRGMTADLAGPVGIAVLTGQVAKQGFAYLLQFAAALSINLAIINVLPFPALDGGRLLFLGIEKLRRRPIEREREALIHNIGFALLMLLVLFVTVRDVSRFGGFFRLVWERIF